MAELNKLERLLESFVQDYKVDVSGASLFFKNNEIEVVISKTTDSSDCFMHYYFKDDYKNKIDIDFPTLYIKNFLRNYVGDTEKPHYLLKDIEQDPKNTLDEVYLNLVDAINNNHRLSPILLQAILRVEMPESKQKSMNKRTKI